MSRVSSPHGTVPHVWSDNADDFDHRDLAANWDALDEGQTPLGTIVQWFRFTAGKPAVPWSAGSVWQPCDGRTVLSANHDFGGGDVVLPDLRNYVLIGSQVTDQSSPAYPGDGVAGTAADTAATAPGIRGVSGTNVAQVIANHYHDHDHTHLLGRAAGTNDVGTAVQDDGGDTYNFNTDAAGTGINAARVNHSHHFLSQYASGARKPDNVNARVKDLPGTHPSQTGMIATSEQKVVSGGSTTQPTGGTAGDNLSVSIQQRSYGVVFLMKVRVTPR